MTGNTKIVTQGQRRQVSYNGWDQIRAQDEGISSGHAVGLPEVVPITAITAAYALGAQAHWPLNETSFNKEVPGDITDVLGKSDQTWDYAWWGTSAPVSGAGLGVLGDTAVQFRDNSVTGNESNYIKLGQVQDSGWTGCTMLWLAVEIATPYWNWNNAWVAQNLVRAGAGTQLVTIYDNNASADTLVYYGSTIDTVSNLAGKFMTITHTSDGTNSCMIVDGTVVKQGANSFSATSYHSPFCWCINGHNTPNGNWNIVTFQHVMLFDSVLTPTQVLDLHNEARGS